MQGREQKLCGDFSLLTIAAIWDFTFKGLIKKNQIFNDFYFVTIAHHAQGLQLHAKF
jgi:hypothetical protein